MSHPLTTAVKKSNPSEVISTCGSSVVNAVGTAAARSKQYEADELKNELKSSSPLSSYGRTTPFQIESLFIMGNQTAEPLGLGRGYILREGGIS